LDNAISKKEKNNISLSNPPQNTHCNPKSRQKYKQNTQILQINNITQKQINTQLNSILKKSKKNNCHYYTSKRMSTTDQLWELKKAL